MKGTVKWFNARKGFGFIQVEKGNDVFVHRNDLNLEIELNENDKVEFEIEKSDRGPKAINVKICQ